MVQSINVQHSSIAFTDKNRKNRTGKVIGGLVGYKLAPQLNNFVTRPLLSVCNPSIKEYFFSKGKALSTMNQFAICKAWKLGIFLAIFSGIEIGGKIQEHFAHKSNNKQ